MFKRLIDQPAGEVTVVINGVAVKVPGNFSVAAAVLAHCGGATRVTPISGAPRAPYCMMGACFECLMEIDGVPNRQACLVQVADGMRINRQPGAREVQA